MLKLRAASSVIEKLKECRSVSGSQNLQLETSDSFWMCDLRMAWLQMILYDTPGVIEKKMHKLDAMMMKNVLSAVINADCVLVLVDACKVPENVCFFIFGFSC